MSNTETKFFFTKIRLQNLPLPEKGRKYYYDTEVIGLMASITCKGTVSFYVHKWVAGKSERIYLGKFPDMTVEQTRKKAAVTKDEIRRGHNPNQEKRKVRAEMPLSVLFDRYMKLHAKPYKRTWKNDQNLYEVHLKSLADRKISDITKKDVQLLHAEIMAEHPHQANRVRSLLSTVYSKGIEWGYEGANPVAGVKKYKEQSRDRFIQQDELKPFFEAVMNESNETLRDFWLLSLYTGARQGNMQEMAWKDINFDRQEWRIPHTKSGEAHSVPLVSYAVDILNWRKTANMNGNPWVFPGIIPGEHLAPPIRAWARLIKSAKLENIRPHDLRRTLGSWMSICGVSLNIIGAALGHKGFTTTHIYARLQQAPVLQGMEMAVKTMLIHGNLLEAQTEIIHFKAAQ